MSVEVYLTFIVAKAYFICNSKKGRGGGKEAFIIFDHMKYFFNYSGKIAEKL
jgi:hypothetical protein